MDKIESFQLDHRKVVAPYVRLANVKTFRSGGVVKKFDVRFTQPNDGKPLSTGAVHSLEHSLATALRKHTEGVIDISPMGCRTGFYVLVDRDMLPSWGNFVYVLLESLRNVLTYESVPGASMIECGNAVDHDLEAAQAAAREFLSHSEELGFVFGR